MVAALAWLAPALGLLAAFVHARSIDLVHSHRLILWVVAQAAFSVVAAASRTTTQAAIRTFLPQVATMTTVAFVLLRAQLDSSDVIEPATLALLFAVATIAGAVGGGGLAVVQWSVLCATRDAASIPSHDATARASQAACVRLAALHALTLGGLALREPRVAWIAALFVLAPAIVAMACSVRRSRLRSWVTRVEAGAVEGWAVVAPRVEWSRLELHPVFGLACQGNTPRVLVRTARAKNPFRGCDWVVPVALVGGARSGQ